MILFSEFHYLKQAKNHDPSLFYPQKPKSQILLKEPLHGFVKPSCDVPRSLDVAVMG